MINSLRAERQRGKDSHFNALSILDFWFLRAFGYGVLKWKQEGGKRWIWRIQPRHSSCPPFAAFNMELASGRWEVGGFTVFISTVALWAQHLIPQQNTAFTEG